MNKVELLADVKFDSKKPVITVLLDTDFTKEIRIAMGSGTQMKEHKTAYPIVVNVVEGHIDFGVNGEVLSMTRGDLIALEGHVPHSLVAKEDSIIRLTLTKYDDTTRVQEIVK